MDETVLQLLRDRFDKIDRDLKALTEALTLHAKTDTEYWTKIDIHAGQLSIVKWVGGSIFSVAFLEWLYRRFGR